MPRPIWRGHLRLARVSCPVALYNARHDRAGIRFNLINPDTGNRIRMITQDAETGKEVERRDLMTVEKFVDTDCLDPLYFDAAYYLVPDGDAGREVYAVLREAIAKTGKTALARMVISQRERTIAIQPTGDGFMAHTLCEERDLNRSKDLFEGLSGIKTDPEMVQLASQLVQRQSLPASLEQASGNTAATDPTGSTRSTASVDVRQPVGRKLRRRLSKEAVKRITAEYTANPRHDLGYEERLKHIQELGNCDRKSAELVRDALPDDVWRRRLGRPRQNSAK
jgi:DNA end-binding protein Ku